MLHVFYRMRVYIFFLIFLDMFKLVICRSTDYGIFKKIHFNNIFSIYKTKF